MSKILYMDDNRAFIDSLESLFASNQSQLIAIYSPVNVQQVAENELPELVILDGDSFDRQGFQVCKILKQKRKTKGIPVLLLVSEQSMDDVRKDCQNSGADDCLIKPISTQELITRAVTLIKKFYLLSRLDHRSKKDVEVRDKLSREIERLHQASRGMEETAVIDRVTGLYNQDYFYDRLKKEYNRAVRYESALSVLSVDIDFFERVIESLGHDAGDYVLMKIANALLVNSNVRAVVCRMEGTLFAVLLPETDAQGGVFEAERLRVAINQTEYIDESLLGTDKDKRRKMDDLKITASLGVASLPNEIPIKNESDFFAMSRKAMDRAKMSGKNKTVSIADL
ncbi:MAG: diguanylate cyclase [Calditrichales bacterium]|nr:MAG: diguanylate cyclase [Calditrichales bacterium]